MNGLRGQVRGLPGWARPVLFVAALPGVVLIALSILALLVSILALLLLTVPVYGLLKGLTTTASYASSGLTVVTPLDVEGIPRRRVDATVIDQPPSTHRDPKAQ